jgi:hypothetical protein
MSEAIVPIESEIEWQGLAHPKKRAYLHALVKCGNSREACKLSGVGYRSIFRWRKQDGLFADYEEKAKAIGMECYKDELESLLDQRIRDDTRKTSDILLMFKLKQLDPSYRDNQARFERTVGEITVVLNIPPRIPRPPDPPLLTEGGEVR